IIMTENIYRRLGLEPARPYRDVVYAAATEVGGAMFAAVSNTVISFLPVFLLTGPEGKLFQPLAYTKTFAYGASMVLAITLVPVIAYYTFKPIRWSARRSLILAIGAGLMSMIATFGILHWGLESTSRWSGWPTAIGVGVMIGACVYRVGREQILDVEQNMVSRTIYAMFRPLFGWTLNHKKLFMVLPTSMVMLGLLVWLGFGKVAYPVEAGLKAVGVDPTETGAWSRMKKVFPGIGREFMPPLDEGSLLYMPSLLPSASLSQGQDIISRQNKAIQEVPEVESVVGKVGRSESALDPAPTSMIETIIILKPEIHWRMVRQERWHSGVSWLSWCNRIWPEERRITKDELMKKLQEKTAIPGVLPTWLQPIQTRIVMLQTGFRAMMGVKIYGADVKEIERIGLQMEKILRKVPGATDVVADRIVGRPYIQYDIDRVAIARYGVKIQDVQDIIEIAVGGENITTTVEGRERYPIRVRYPRELRERFDDLERILVPTSTGAQVPIGMVAKISYVIGPQELKSENGLLVGYVTMNTRDRDEVSVVEDAEALLQAEKARSDALIKAGKHEEATLVVPPGYYWKWSGQFENQQRATQQLSWMVPLVLFGMFVMLYMGLGRWWLALIVWFCILVSAAGGFAMLLWYGSNLSVAVWVGFIALFGVADDAAVVILSFLEDTFKEAKPRNVGAIRGLVIEASLKRVRPLLMSTATTVIGLFPIFLLSGRGSDVMQPMAIPCVGGMGVQLIAFLLAPCLYCMVKEWQFLRGLSLGDEPEAVTQPVQVPDTPSKDANII
ncbi:MAG: efflux RND transporter permease subunit, partial [Planctomycetes bacterium]|nr:efflux RND transporter permease subunit [Planctomycetota bacterium]